MPIVDPRFMAHQRARFMRPDAYRYVRRGKPPAQSDIEAGWASGARRTEEEQYTSGSRSLRALAELRCDLAQLKSSLKAIRIGLAAGKSIASRKYSPDQPRIPAGEPGGWIYGGDTLARSRMGAGSGRELLDRNGVRLLPYGRRFSESVVKRPTGMTRKINIGYRKGSNTIGCVVRDHDMPTWGTTGWRSFRLGYVKLRSS